MGRAGAGRRRSGKEIRHVPWGNYVGSRHRAARASVGAPAAIAADAHAAAIESVVATSARSECG